jgi:phage terminase large subunit
MSAQVRLKPVDIETAAVFEPLLRPSRYKGAHGGRGSGKSWFFAGLLVEEHLANQGFRSVCIREVQKSLKESAKRLIESKIEEFGLGASDGFKVLADRIETPGGGLVIFQGMQDHTAESIKSLEGFNRAWVEEAQTLSARSLQLLRPTIRAPGSELWFSWNPRSKKDPVDAMFRAGEAPTNAVVVQANWSDNPWLPAELEQERLDCLRADPDQYAHIWDGDYVTVAEGAYFAKNLAQARADGRISDDVTADPLMTTRAFFDIGGTGDKADATAIWIAQFVGTTIRVLDYYEAVGQELSEHVHWLRRSGYESALIHLPHDGAQHDKVQRVTYASALREAGFAVEVHPNQIGAKMIRIDAARRLFPSMVFHKTKCAAGLEALGWYHEKMDETRQVGLGPEHDWSSHGADAFGLLALSYEAPRAARKIIYKSTGIV